MSFDEVSSFGQKLTHSNFMPRGSGTSGVDHDNQLDVDSGMYYNTTQARQRGQSRTGDESVNIGNLLEEDESAATKGLLSSLIDGKSRTPMDLIQQDFPATPSSIYSTNRLFAGQSATAQQELDKGDESLLKSIPSGLSGQRTGQQSNNALDHATMAMQQLYVSGEEERLHPSGGHSQSYGLRQQQGNNTSGNSNSRANSNANSSQTPLASHSQGTPQVDPSTGQPNPYRNQPPMQMSLPASAASGGGSQQAPQQPPVQYIPLDANQVPPGQGGPPGAQQTTFYVQQPMYLDQNGQPIYYRVGPGAPFQQEMIYTTNPDGSAGEPMMTYVPYPPPNGQQMPAQGYWPGGVPTGPDQNGNMYVATGPNGQPVDSRRMMYNPPPYMMQSGGPGGGGRGGYMPDRRLDDRKDYRGGEGGGGGGGGRGNRNRDNFGNHNLSGGSGGGGGGSGGGGSGANSGRINSSVNPMRDPLVDEFRSTYGKSRQWELVDLLGHVVAFCQDQHGSRFIQQKLEVCPDVDKQLIFDEIIPSAHSLMTDVFGNYVLQKLFEYGTPDQCETLALLLTGQSVQLSMQMYGCRVVQKALEYVSTQRLIALVSEFENTQVLLRCVHDSNGNHVIQKCIEVVSKVAKEASTPELSEYLSSRIMFIINSFQGRVKELSSHPYGCRVVQRILEHCSNPQKAIILEELRKCCAELVQDCYGNYVIQFVMQHGWEADRAVLIKEVQAHLLEFATHKFASNVVEKCLQYASKRDRDEMIWTIINVTFDLNNPVDAKTGHCVLENMVRDPYANYVVQKVIDVSDERQRAAIMRYVRENIVQLRRYTYGKHIIVRLEKITNEKF